MRLRSFKSALVAACLVATAPVALAQEAAPARCSLLGQVITTSFLQFAAALASNRGDEIALASDRMANLTTTYTNLSCDPAPLGRALDCVLESAGDDGPRAVAQNCLATEGFLGG